MGHRFRQLDWRDKTVLIVDDSDTCFEFLSALLSPTKIEIIRASNGKDAIELCSSGKKINLVLLDMLLPDSTGFELAGIIKSALNVPVIACTALAMSFEREKCLRSGCDDYISKPVNTALLAHKLIKFMNQNAATKASVLN